MANENKPEGGAPPAAAPPPDEVKAVERLQKEIVDIVKAQSKGVENLEAKVDDVSERVETLQKELGEDQKAAIERLRDQLEEIRSDVNRPAGFAPQERKSVIERAMENEEFKRTLDDKLFKGFSKFHVYAPIKGLFPPSEQKTLIDSSTVGSSTPGILTPQRVGFVPLARRRLTLRDVLPSRSTTSNAVEFIRATSAPLVSPQTEGSAKGEAALTTTIATATVRTLAAWIPATRQVLADWSDLQRFIEDELLFALKKKEEEQILSGDGMGQNLEGLITGATAYDTGRNVGSDTKLDTLRHGIAQLEAVDEEPSFLVIHPDDAEAVDLIKDQASNIGNYVAGEPKAPGDVMSTLWRMSVVKTTAMDAGSFLVGDARRAEIFDRQEAIIDISTEHANFFTENKVAIRVEERIALAIYRTSAFVYGTFP